MHPKISVLMSVYNSERWLAASIESVLNQTFGDFEFIIVNDGSADGSGLLIKQYAEKDSRICVFDKQNTGLADSLNYGIARAKGEWIARIDADDLCMPDRLQKQMEVAESRDDIVLIGTGLTLIDDESIPFKKYRYPHQHKSLLRSLVSLDRFFAHSSVLYRTRSVRDVGGYRARILRAEDHDLWLRLSEVGLMYCVEEPLVQIRKHSNQISHDENGERQLVDSHVAIVSYWLRRAGQVDPVNASLEEFEAFHNWVKECLKDCGVFERALFLVEIKCLLNQTRGAIKALGLSKYVLTHPLNAARRLSKRFINSSLPKKLAAQWAYKMHE